MVNKPIKFVGTGEKPEALDHIDEILDGNRRNIEHMISTGFAVIGTPDDFTNPNDVGFDHFFGYVNMWHAHNFYPEVNDSIRLAYDDLARDAFGIYEAEMSEDTYRLEQVATVTA